jgi:hypothetical protein
MLCSLYQAPTADERIERGQCAKGPSHPCATAAGLPAQCNVQSSDSTMDSCKSLNARISVKSAPNAFKLFSDDSWEPCAKPGQISRLQVHSGSHRSSSWSPNPRPSSSRSRSGPSSSSNSIGSASSFSSSDSCRCVELYKCS